MTEPRRWLDDDSNAPPGARELLSQAQRTTPIDRRALSISALLVAKIAATPVAAAALPLVAKLAASLAMVTVASAVAVQIAMPTRGDTASAGTRKPQSAIHARAHRERMDPRVIAPAPEPTQVTLLNADAPQTAQTAPAIAESVPVAAAKLRAASVTRSPTRHTVIDAAPTPMIAAPLPEATETVAPAPTDPLAVEVQWLDAARGLLDHDAASALAQAQAHAMRFPNGALAAERELIAVDALHRLGRQAEAEARAQAVLRRFPGSLYRERLRSLLHATR